MKKPVWITWNDHRRSRELAAHWGMNYKVFEYSGSMFIRYINLSTKTLMYINKNDPDIIICQNPSVVLSALLAFICNMKKITLVVDRHSNFKIALRKSLFPKWKIFHLVSDYSLRNADLTIVTNREAADYVSSIGGKPVVLPDKLPSDLSGVKRKLNGDVNFLFICSFSSDEPVDAVLACFKRLDKNYHVYVTGNFKKHQNWQQYCDDENIHFLGFVNEDIYLSYLKSVDATIVLTDMPMTLNCGSYESVKAGKPQVVADSLVIKEWFRSGAVYVDPKDENSIFYGIRETIERLDDLKIAQRKFSETLESDWSVLEEKFRRAVTQNSGHKF